MAIAITLRQFLQNENIDYEILHHDKSRTSLETAANAHVSGDCVAKSVLLEDDTGYVMVVLPASHELDMARIHEHISRPLTFAHETVLARLFSDCEPGAIPPIGTAYGIETLIDDSLAEQPDIYFEAGDHEALVHVNAENFDDLTRDAMHGHFSHHL
ncbi:YbaK/EbsC family protein [Sulfuriflexus sp.]|uniref:aminoacyl-tRNA deacylase n=1 Tax=Sulfuriflexus sp. TaxID=2015443 RepID=UPI0028CE14A1|nr:YbaK/EbsC family protein [Sulfuriflexus sp.]MDT8404170.1 YbaK/EbsC family protein [Sulfuriflexus sp.]